MRRMAAVGAVAVLAGGLVGAGGTAAAAERKAQSLYFERCLKGGCYRSAVVKGVPGGSKLTTIVPARDGGGEFDLSPDGKQVVYTASTKKDGIVLFVREIATGRVRQLTFQDPRVPNDAAYDSAPRWSPDGRTIMFKRGFFGCIGCNRPASSLYRVPATGGALVRVPFDGSFVWSPDGSRIAVITSSGSVNRLLTARPDGSGARVLVRLKGDYVGFDGLDWARDGRIVFQQTNDAKKPFVDLLRVISAKGGKPRTLTRLPQKGYGFAFPVWSADARYVYLTLSLKNSASRLYRLRATKSAKPQPVAPKTMNRRSPLLRF